MRPILTTPLKLIPCSREMIQEEQEIDNGGMEKVPPAPKPQNVLATAIIPNHDNLTYL
jgi:hypothetical protein